MLSTEGKSAPGLDGIDQQDFDKIQLVQGCFPFQIGLQQRIPGKVLQGIYPYPINAIYVMYVVRGRNYVILNYTTNIEIIEVIPPVWRNPATPPINNTWYDTFGSYELGLISRLWAAGAWATGVGVCESLIEGFYDPFLVYAKIASNAVDLSNLPKAVTDESGTPTTEDTGPKYKYPIDPPDIILRRIYGLADNSCEGQGTQPVESDDYIKLYNSPGDYTGTLITVLDLAPGDRLTWNGITVGRADDLNMGLVLSALCPLLPHPPLPDPKVYYLNLSDGEFGQES